jgi:hypothetical protein
MGPRQRRRRRLSPTPTLSLSYPQHRLLHITQLVAMATGNTMMRRTSSRVYFSVVHLDEFGVNATAAKLHVLDLGASGGISDVWWQRWGHGPGGV